MSEIQEMKRFYDFLSYAKKLGFDVEFTTSHLQVNQGSQYGCFKTLDQALEYLKGWENAFEFKKQSEKEAVCDMVGFVENIANVGLDFGDGKIEFDEKFIGEARKVLGKFEFWISGYFDDTEV